MKKVFYLSILPLIISGCESGEMISLEERILSSSFSESIKSIESSNQFTAGGSLGSVNIGQGYNSVTQQILKQTIDTSNAQYSNTKTVSEIDLKLKFAESVEELFAFSSSSLTASAEYGIFNANLYHKKVRSTKNNRFKSFLIIDAKYSTSSRSMKNKTLESTAKELINSSKYEEYYSDYGDQFITSKVLGGRASMIYSFQSRSSESKKSVKNAFSAALDGLVIDASVNVDLNKVFNQISNDVSYELEYQFNGGEIDTLPSSNPNQIMDFVLKKWPKLVAANPVIVNISVADFTQIQDLDLKAKTEIIKNINRQHQSLSRISRQENDLNKIVGDLTFSKERPELYPSINSESINDLIATCNDSLDQIKGTKELCNISPSLCPINQNFIPEILSELVVTPVFDLPEVFRFDENWSGARELLTANIKPQESFLFNASGHWRPRWENGSYGNCMTYTGGKKGLCQLSLQIIRGENGFSRPDWDVFGNIIITNESIDPIDVYAVISTSKVPRYKKCDACEGKEMPRIKFAKLNHIVPFESAELAIR